MTGLIYKKIPAIMNELGAVEKGRKNQSQGYYFRGIDDFYSALQPLLSKHGVFCAPTVLRELREEKQTKSGANMTYTVLTVEFAFYAEDGSSFKAATVGEASDSGDKSANKAMSAALKYLFMQVFCVPSEEDNDTENHSPEFAPRGSAPSALKAVPSDPAEFVVTIGKKFRDMKLKDCDDSELASFAEWMRNKATEERKPLDAEALKNVKAIEAYLDAKLRPANTGAK